MTSVLQLLSPPVCELVLVIAPVHICLLYFELICMLETPLQDFRVVYTYL